MRLPRSPMFYLFSLPVSAFAGLGMYTAYDSVYGILVRRQLYLAWNGTSRYFGDYQTPPNDDDIPSTDPSAKKPKLGPPYPRTYH